MNASGTGVDIVIHDVLVVDDDRAFSEIVGESLRDRDLRVTTLSDPRRASALVGETEFAVAVIDLVMPEMGGLDLARELHRLSPGTEIVVLTGHADLRSAIEGIRAELFDYLQKDSLDMVRLVRAVRAAIARRQLRRENERLVRSLASTARRLQVLALHSAALAGERHTDVLFETLIAAARELLEAERVRLVLVDRNELGDLTIRETVGDGELSPGGFFAAGDGILGRVIETGVAERIADAQEHPSYSPRCDDLGARLPGLVCAPFVAPSILGVLMAGGRERPFDDEDLALLLSLARQGAVALLNTQSAEAAQNFATHVSEMLVSLLDAQDEWYHGHSRAVAALTDMLTRRLGLPEEERRTLHFAGLLHDIGKLRLRPGLLSLEELPTPEDLQEIRRHPSLGVEMILPISRWVALVPAILTHHERWDGRGYPRGLAGEAIPLGGRILAIAEAFEAMTRRTPRRAARTTTEALAEVTACAGTAFDPDLALAFVEEYGAHQAQLEGEID